MCAGDPIIPKYITSLFIPTLDILQGFNKNEGKIQHEVTQDGKKQHENASLKCNTLNSHSKNSPLLNINQNFDLHLEYCLNNGALVQILENTIQHKSSIDDSTFNLKTENSKLQNLIHTIKADLCQTQFTRFSIYQQNSTDNIVSFPCKLQSMPNVMKISQNDTTNDLKVKGFCRSDKPEILFKILSKFSIPNSCENVLPLSKIMRNMTNKFRLYQERYFKKFSFRFHKIRRRKKRSKRKRNKKVLMKYNFLNNNKIFFKSCLYKNNSNSSNSRESDLMKSSTIFPKRMLTRRNRLSQIYSENSNEVMPRLKNYEKKGLETNCATSFKNDLPAKTNFKKRPEEDRSKERSQNTIKLIDKYLNILSTDHEIMPKNPIIEQRSKIKHKRDSSNTAGTGFKRRTMSEERNNETRTNVTYIATETEKNIGKRKLHKNISSSTDSLYNPEDIVTSTSESRHLRPSSGYRLRPLSSRRRMHSSLDGLCCDSDGFGQKLLTAAVLARIDNALTDLVEEEKQKIMKLNSSRSLYSSHETIIDPQMITKNYCLTRPKTREPRGVLIRIRPKISSDLIDKHHKYFTTKKPFKPRILKTDIGSKLKPHRLYRYNRPNRKKKKPIENASKYSDDFESPLSSQGTSSDEENHEKNCRGFPSSVDFSNDKGIKESFPGPASIVDDEEDTCYGSDQIDSDPINQQVGCFKEEPAPKMLQRDSGEFSIDSAYTGSRQATPDIKNFSSDLKKKSTGAISKSPTIISTQKRNTLVGVLNDCKRFLMEKIKESGLYSDSHINNLLEYYSKKWQHIPEREMSIIIGFIRRDLGVSVPPTVYISYIQNNDTPSVRENDELSTENLLTTLSHTLPQYQKPAKTERKAMSASCSPEHLIQVHNKEKSSINSLESILINNEAPIENKFRVVAKKSAKARFFDSVKDIDNPEKRDEVAARHLCQFDESFNDDEDWIRETCGDQMLKNVKESLKESYSPVNDFLTSTEDIEKMANDLCDEFGFVL